MRWIHGPLLLSSLLLAACSGGPDDTDGAATTSDPGTTAGGGESATTTAASASAGSTEGTGTTTAGATTAASGSATATTTGDPTTGPTSAPTSDPTTGDPTTSTTTTGDTDTDTGGADLCAPAPVGDPCQTDDDCAIAGDCCSCVAYNPSMSSPGNCGGNCKQDRCSEWGLDAAACEAGVCVVKGKSCNADKVVCEVEPPPCEDGTLPQVEGSCYTGACLPLAACDWVPECSLCEGSVCAITEGPGCTHRRCVPPIPECDGLPPCACLGEIFCQPPHDQCSEEQGALVCSL